MLQPAWMRRPGRSWVALILSAAASLAAVPALAHAVLMDSSPKAGEMLATSPKEVTASFNESVGPIFFKILDRSGKEVGDAGEIKLDGLKMILPLRATLPNGTYVFTYRVISADTHPVGTTFGFSIGEPMQAGAALAQDSGGGKTAWTYAVALNRWLLYCAMLLAAGSALFSLSLSVPRAVDERAYALGRGAAIAAAISYVLAIGFGGAEMVMASATGLFSGKTWSNGLASTLTPSAAIGVPAMLLLLWAYSAGPQAARRGALAVGAAAAVGSFLVTGHAATAAPVWLMATAVGLHLFGTAFWFGSLLPLLASAGLLKPRESGALMTQFSNRAVLAVGAVIVSGLIITWTQVASAANLFGNDYSRNLLIKLLLFLAVIVIAIYNKVSLTPALEKDDATAAARIQRSIRIETCLYVLILGAAMSLTLTTPPRAIVAPGAGGAAAMGPGMAGMDGIRKTVTAANGYSVDLELTPAKAGENMLMATVKDASGKALTSMADLEITAALPAAGISDIRLKGKPVANGMWHVMIGEMIIPGQWQLGVEAFVSDFDKVEFATEVEIK